MIEYNNEILVQEKIHFYLFPLFSVWRSLSCWHLSQDWTRTNILVFLRTFVYYGMLSKRLMCGGTRCRLAYRWICTTQYPSSANKRMHSAGRLSLISNACPLDWRCPWPRSIHVFTKQLISFGKTRNALNWSRPIPIQWKWKCKRCRNITQAASQMH